MPLPTFFSQAGNFLNTLQGGVDPRTGLFNISLPLVNLHSCSLAGPAFALSLHYSPLSVQNEGFGRGFSLNLTRYDKTTGRLVLSTGEVYRMSSSGDSVRQKKLQNFLYKKTDDSNCVVIHKSGLTEYLSLYDTVYVPVLITTPEGRSLKLTWGSTYNPVRLLKVEDDTGVVLCSVSYPDESVASTSFRLLPGDDRYGYDISFLFTRALLTNVASNADGVWREWSFSYEDVGPGKIYRVITGLTTPLGMQETVAYYAEKGMNFPDVAGLPPLPCVATHTVSPGGGQPAGITLWEWTQKNYLGKDAGLNQWQPDTDAMLNILLIDYVYGSTEKRMDKDGTTALCEVTHRYNSYHLLVSESTLRAGKTCTETTEYYAKPGATFDEQPEQYALPKLKTEFWRNDNSTPPRIRKTARQFDKAGNPRRQVAPDGTVTKYVYYPARGGRRCPADPQGFIRYLKRKTVTPQKVKGDEVPTVMEYTWKKLSSLSGEGYAVIPARVKETTGNVQTVVRRTYYNDKNNALTYGREKQRSITLFPDINENPKTSFLRKQNYLCESRKDGLFQSETLTTHDDISVTRSTLRHPVLGHLLSETDTQDVTVAYSYDKTGRPLSRTVAPGTGYERKTTWSYRIDPTGPVTTETDPAGNQTSTGFDGRCRRILQQRLDNDLTQTMYETATWSYTPLGEAETTSSTDWLTLNREKFSVTMTASRDGWGSISEQKTSDGIKTVQMNDPVALATCAYTQGDGDGKELSTGTFTSVLDERSLQPQKYMWSDINTQALCIRLYQWDGLGRLRQLTDELNHCTAWTYDVHGRVLTQTLPDGSIIERTYAPHLAGQKIASITVKTAKDAAGNQKVWKLGTQEFDGSGRLVKQVSGGRTTTYTYEGASPVPSTVTQPSGNELKFEYIPELGNAVSKMTAGSVTQTFAYHAATGALVSAEENGVKIQRTRYPSGRLKKETSTQAESVFDADYWYTLSGATDRVRDIDKKTTRYTRDASGRITTITDDALTVSLKYDLLGRLSEQKVTGVKTQATLTTALAYDDFSREISRTVSDSTGSNITLSRTWQKNNLLATRITQKDGVQIRKETFAYDTRNRLTEYTVGGSSLPVDAYGHQMTAQKYQYDALNNLTTVITPLSNDVGSIDVATYHYDNKDDPTQLTSVTHTLTDAYPAKIALEYDADGRMTKDESGRTRHYDASGRLVSTDKSYRYGYDALNRLVTQTVSDTDTRQLYYRSDRLVNEVQTAQQKQTISRQITTDGHACVGVSTGDRLTLTAVDLHGSLQWSRDTSKDKGTEHAWSPSGGGNPTGQLPAFNGERADPVTGNYLLGNGYRAYSPALMRFTCPDSLSPFGAGGINPYAYCAGDPVNLTDPSGHISWQGIVGILTGIVGIGLAVVTGGMSVMAAGCIGAAVDAASTTSLVAGGLGLVADATGIASGALEDRNPEASRILGWVSMATGLASVVTGIGAGTMKAGRVVAHREAESLEMQVMRRSSSTSSTSSISSTKSVTGISDLPPEMIRNIGRNLPLEDLKSFRAASAQFADAIPVRDVIRRTSPVQRFATVLGRVDTEVIADFGSQYGFYYQRVARLKSYMDLNGFDNAARLEVSNINAGLSRHYGEGFNEVSHFFMLQRQFRKRQIMSERDYVALEDIL